MVTDISRCGRSEGVRVMVTDMSRCGRSEGVGVMVTDMSRCGRSEGVGVMVTDMSQCGRSEGVRVFYATFNNISVIFWWSVLLVEETGVPGEKPLTCRNSLTDRQIKTICLSMNGGRDII